MKINLGCGKSPLAGWLNIDSREHPGVDLVADLDRCRTVPLPLADDSVDEFSASHLIEHLSDPLAFMQELHRIAKPGARAVFRVPYGSSDDAWEDPTHVRPYFLQSFDYFSQPYYWRADYGYRGDWKVERIELFVDPQRISLYADTTLIAVNTLRNVVREMVAELVAVKPARQPLRELQTRPDIRIVSA